MLLGQLGGQANLIDVMSKQLRAMDVLPHLHGHRGGGYVGMLGCGDHNCINIVLLLIEHHPEILVFGDIRELPVEARDWPATSILLGFNVAREVGIHITKGRHVYAAHLEHLGNDISPVPSGTDNCDVDQVARGGLAEYVPGNNRAGRCGCGSAQEMTPGKF